MSELLRECTDISETPREPEQTSVRQFVRTPGPPINRLECCRPLRREFAATVRPSLVEDPVRQESASRGPVVPRNPDVTSLRAKLPQLAQAFLESPGRRSRVSLGEGIPLPSPDRLE